MENEVSARNLRAVPSEEALTQWLSASDERDARILRELEDALTHLAKRYPLRVWQLRRDLKWLRRTAKDLGYEWGR